MLLCYDSPGKWTCPFVVIFSSYPWSTHNNYISLPFREMKWQVLHRCGSAEHQRGTQAASTLVSSEDVMLVGSNHLGRTWILEVSCWPKLNQFETHYRTEWHSSKPWSWSSSCARTNSETTGDFYPQPYLHSGMGSSTWILLFFRQGDRNGRYLRDMSCSASMVVQDQPRSVHQKSWRPEGRDTIYSKCWKKRQNGKD